MEQLETAQRLADCSFGVNGVLFWGKLRASMEQLETAQRLAGCSFGVGGMPFWGKLRASMEQLETAQRLADCSFGVSGVRFWGKPKARMEQIQPFHGNSLTLDEGGTPLSRPLFEAISSAQGRPEPKVRALGRRQAPLFRVDSKR